MTKFQCLNCINLDIKIPDKAICTGYYEAGMIERSVYGHDCPYYNQKEIRNRKCWYCGKDIDAGEDYRSYAIVQMEDETMHMVYVHVSCLEFDEEHPLARVLEKEAGK